MVKSNKGPRSVENVTIALDILSKITVPHLYNQVQLGEKTLPPSQKKSNPFTSEHRDELSTMISRLASAYYDFNINDPNGVKTHKDILKESSKATAIPRSPDAFRMADEEVYESRLSLQRILNTGKIVDESQISSRSIASLSYYHRDLINFINNNHVVEGQPRIPIKHDDKGAWLHTSTFNQYIHAYIYMYSLQHEVAKIYVSSDKLMMTSLGEFFNSEWDETDRSLFQLSGLSPDNTIKYKKKGINEIEVKGIKILNFNKLLKFLILPMSERPDKDNITNDTLETLESFSNYMKDAKEFRDAEKMSVNDTVDKKKKQENKALERKKKKQEKRLNDDNIKKSLLLSRKNLPQASRK